MCLCFHNIYVRKLKKVPKHLVNYPQLPYNSEFVTVHVSQFIEKAGVTDWRPVNPTAWKTGENLQ